MAMDRMINYYMDACFDVDAVFGTDAYTNENDDWLNIYANYDMTSGLVCNTLDLELHRSDGSVESLSYKLSAAEQQMLLPKMDRYCQYQTGMPLKEYSVVCLERDSPVAVSKSIPSHNEKASPKTTSKKKKETKTYER